MQHLRHTYIDPYDQEHISYGPECEIVIKNKHLTHTGYIVAGTRMTVGQFHEMGERIRRKQSEAFDEMLNKKIWAVDDKTQLNLWGLQ